MTIVQTVLVYAVIPAVVITIFAALTMWPKTRKNGRYRSGEDWEHDPVWWSANPGGAPGPASADGADDALGARALGAHGLGSGAQSSVGTVTDVVGGGARGTW
ncbi:MAG: hypothetical protein ABI251_15140 [Mycobacteriaceae bacterium]